MIHESDGWASSRFVTSSLEDLRNTAIAIEATSYLNDFLDRPSSKERLTPALGGFPFALKTHILESIKTFRTFDITPIFVFDGLDVGKKVQPFQASSDAAETISKAWDLYSNQQGNQAVDAFGVSGYARPEMYFRLLQTILRESKVEFLVAPFNARGQLAYLAHHGGDYIDAVAGSPELLLFGVDKVITDFDTDRASFTYVKEQSYIEDLGLSSNDMFIDACLLAGNGQIPAIPPIDISPPRRPQVLRQAIDLLNRYGQSGISVCTNFKNEDRMRRTGYLDRYMRAKLEVKHHIVLTSAGKVVPLEPESSPSDLHDLIGQRLPDELYYYLSKGAIGPRTLNQLTSQQIFEVVPVDGGASPEYQRLVQEQLTPLRGAALSLLAYSLTRAYQHRQVKLKCWFDLEKENTISISDLASPRPLIADWNVHGSILNEKHNLKDGQITLSSTLQALNDPSYAAKTITPHDPTKLLSSNREVTSNSLWRFFRIREYVNEKHGLTPWGNVLDTILSNLPPSLDFEEAAVLAVELLKLNLLTSDTMFPNYAGGPVKGTENDRKNCILLSRVACLGKFRHKPICFNGPLSRHLLGYSSIINVTRKALRDLLEMSLATLLLNGDADREQIDLAAIGLELPFLLANDCGLGILMKHYLDELPTVDPPISDEHKDVAKTKGASWFTSCEDFRGDLERAFTLWDAVYAGVKVANELGLIKGRAGWDQADEWSKTRR